AGNAYTLYLLNRTITGSSLEVDAIDTVISPVQRHSLPLPPDYVTLDSIHTMGQLYPVGQVISVDARTRSRSASAIQFEDDASEGAEAGTTYRISVEVDNVTSLVAD